MNDMLLRRDLPPIDLVAKAVDASINPPFFALQFFAAP